LGYFNTEIEAAKFVNFVCKKESMKIRNPQLSEEETETFTWPSRRRKVAIFLYTFLFALMASTLVFFHQLINIC
jgi:hypothetical protein